MLELAKNHPEQAEPVLEEYLSKHPEDLLTLRLLGLTKRNLNKHKEAINLFEQAIRLDPQDAETYNQLALTHRELGNLLTALMHMSNAVDRNPSAQNWTNLGKLSIELKNLDEAELFLKKAIEVDPTFVSAQYDLSLVYALQGHWSLFFPQYEWRLRYFDDLDPQYPIPLWEGQDIKNRRLLVYGEQGYGDWIHFSRFLPLARERGAYVVLCCPTSLVRLLLPLADEAVDRYNPSIAADFRCSVVSLPWLLQC